jgi:hypothetical protein
MKRIGSLILIAIISLQSCEVDDICIESVLTPKMIVEFYDATDTQTSKEVPKLSVWALGKDKLYTDQKTDSIAVPLDLNNSYTTYLLSNDSVVDSLYIYHQNNDVFVSRSCGYKVNFKITEDTHTTKSWINSIEIAKQQINNEQEIHLKIYH